MWRVKREKGRETERRNRKIEKGCGELRERWKEWVGMSVVVRTVMKGT